MSKRVVLTGIALIFQIMQLIKNRAKRIAKQKLLSIATQLSALSPTQLIKNFDKLEDYGICFGQAFASEKCTAIFKPKQNVIISKMYQLKKVPFRTEVQNFRQLIRVKRPTFFTLNDKFSSIPILETQKLPTMTTHSMEKYSSIDKSSEINIVIYLINLIKNIRVPYVSESTFCEDYLPQGSQVAILGKYKRQASGKICCEKPIMMGRSKNHLIQKLQQKFSQLKIEKYAMVLGITFCVGFLLKQAYRFYQKDKLKKADPIQNFEKLYVKSRVCFGCHEKLSNFILEACGHLSMCKQCQQKLKVCGECSKKADTGFEIYAC